MPKSSATKSKNKSTEKITFAIAILGAIGTLITIIIFLTGRQSLPEFLQNLSGTPDSEILYQDDFSYTNDRWGTVQDQWSKRRYQNGEYLIWVGDNIGQSSSGFSSEYSSWLSAWSTLEIRQENVAVEVDVRVVSESLDGTYGLIFGYKDSNNFYYFEITPRGRWDLVQRINGEYHDLIRFKDDPDLAIGLGKYTNRLRIEIMKSEVVLYVNSQKMAGAKVPVTTNTIGLWVNGYSPNFEAAFDNLLITSLNP